jgi:hypothetical protein
MDDLTRVEIIKNGWEMHRVVEEWILHHPATKGTASVTPDWLDKQRLLLADMAIHLLQTALKPGDIALAQLKNNLHAILTISDQFLPHADLKRATEKIYGRECDAGL